jgi:hypothetical protein
MENPITLVPLVRVEDLLAGLENDYPRGGSKVIIYEAKIG